MSPVVAGLVALLVLPAAARAQLRSIDYLYVDANEGGSSGGHVGLRVDDDVFHFEYRPPGILVLRREPFDEFRRHYNRLENRNIEVSRIPVSDETYRRVRDRFRARHFIQQQHLEALDTARADRRILEEMLQGDVALEGAGFFAEARPDDRVPDPTLLALRRRALDTYGVDFFATRREALLQRLAALEPDRGPSPPVRISADGIPPAAYAFPQRYRDTLTALVALEILDSARPLRPEATITAVGDEPSVTEDDARMATRLSETLAASLVRLLDSRRPDWGFPLLLGMARLAALERTRESGRWTFLDGFRSPPDAIDRTPVRAHPEVIAAMLSEAMAESANVRRRLVERLDTDGGFAESDFAHLEAVGNRIAEIHRALAEGRDLRHRLSLPSRRGGSPALLAPSREALAVTLAMVVEQEAAHARALENLYRYNLVSRNCVSELVGEIDAALAGGRAEEAFDFIPALSALTLGDRYGVTAVFQIPSYRRAELARLYEKEHVLRVFLRESNTVTSTLYRRNPRDSVFLFFTDEAVVTRPLLGVANLVTGVVTSAVGLAWLPVDGGKLLRAGLWGALYSLPELVFQNIRKGSFEPAGVKW